jgi:competence protein ComEC
MLSAEFIDSAPPVETKRPFWAAMRAALVAEVRANLDRGVLWTPVAFGLGCSAYLEVRFEPALWILAVMAAAFGVTWWSCRRWNARQAVVVLASLMAFGAMGGLAGKLRSDRVAAPLMSGERIVRRVDGFVVDVVSPGAGGPRLLIGPGARADSATNPRDDRREPGSGARPSRALARDARCAAAARCPGGV